MDNNTIQGHGERCDMCQGHGGWNHHHWRHVIIKILVALFIFWSGVQFGELKALIHAAYDYQNYGSGMMGWNQPDQGYARGPVMFYSSNGQETVRTMMGTTSRAY